MFAIAMTILIFAEHINTADGEYLIRCELKLDFENIIIYSSRLIITLSKMDSFTFSSRLVNSQWTKM